MDRSKRTGPKPQVGVKGLLCAVLALGACSLGGSRNVLVAPDERFGHRYEGRQGERETLTITPPDSAESYFYYPAVVESLHVRNAPFDPALPVDAQRVEVEVLIKGLLPDDCSELHDIEQWRAGHIIHLTLQMRRPIGAVCRRIGRPFRFYTFLEGEYGQGDYVIKMGEDVFAFVIQAEPE